MTRRRDRDDVAKKISEQAIIAEQGVNLVARRVLAMGFAWHPTTAAFDSGIDGIIELRDRDTHDALNLIIQVQVKSTRGRWPRETDIDFDFLCEERDLNYWRQGNAPVVLVVVRAESNEAYWVSIKDYFRDPLLVKSRRVRFTKANSGFDINSRDALIKLAVPPNAGLYPRPAHKAETVFSNLIRVSSLPSRLFSATTELGRRGEVWKALGDAASSRAEFVYRGKRILSPHDLSAPEWKSAVDQGTAEEFDTTEWSLSEDDERRNDFTELLGRMLTERCKRMGIRYHSAHEFYFFAAPDDLSNRTIPYRSIKQSTSRSVFQKYESKSGFVYYRHMAFEAQFHRYDASWFLAVVPTYHYTVDGRQQLRYYESKVRGIKALENNPAVLGQVFFLAQQLAAADADLFDVEDRAYPFLGFGTLERFSIDVGIEDSMWLPPARESVPADSISAPDPGALPELPFDPEPNA